MRTVLEKWEELIERSSGMRLALRLIAPTIQEFFAQDIGKFLKDGQTIYLAPEYKSILA